ncbi:MAG TPA: PAS domain S-box protein, partial [Phormidium sp.]
MEVVTMYLQQTLQPNNLRQVQPKCQETHPTVHEELNTYRSLYESLPFPYFILDVASSIVTLNLSGVRRLGYTPNELIAKPIFGLVHSDDRGMMQAKLEQLLNSVPNDSHPESADMPEDRCTSWIFRQVCKDGSIRWANA